MTTLQFANTHNLVAFLAKPAESEGFEQIVDFLNINPIRYALTINPTIYTSCIEQFWATVKVKTVNGEVQLQALVDGKKIIITEAFVRHDLQLNDEEGMDCLPNATIFEELARMGPKRKDTRVPQPSDPTDNVADEAVNEETDDSLVRAATTTSSLEAEQDSGRYGDEEMFDTGVLDGDEVLAEPEVTVKDVNLSVDEVTLTQALAALKSAKVQEKVNVVEELSKSITTTLTLTTTTATTTIIVVSTRPKAKGLVIHEEEQATTPTVSSKQPSQVKAHDKGKGIMVEEPMKMKKKDQISLDEELAFKLQAEEEEEERLAREKAQREEEANIVS
ncbi:hypothetical protein Tco_0058344 [Tanacetum coccineum]